MEYFEYSYVLEDLLGTGILSALLGTIPSSLLGIATYVLTALALYTVAQRRGLNRPWLAWIPVISCWILGSLSDQYRYVVKNEIKSKRKVLLVLNVLMSVLSIAITGIAVAMVVGIFSGAMQGFQEHRMLEAALGPAVGMLGLCLPLAGVAIAFAVIRYMALYDLYRSMDPSNSVLFLVLSILFGITEPFFLFFNRNKDAGMPPRRQEPIYTYQEQHDYTYQEQSPYACQPQHDPQEDANYIYEAPSGQEPQWPQTARQPWEQENKDYL